MKNKITVYVSFVVVAAVAHSNARAHASTEMIEVALIFYRICTWNVSFFQYTNCRHTKASCACALINEFTSMHIHFYTNIFHSFIHLSRYHFVCHSHVTFSNMIWMMNIDVMLFAVLLSYANKYVILWRSLTWAMSFLAFSICSLSPSQSRCDVMCCMSTLSILNACKIMVFPHSAIENAQATHTQHIHVQTHTTNIMMFVMSKEMELRLFFLF